MINIHLAWYCENRSIYHNGLQNKKKNNSEMTMVFINRSQRINDVMHSMHTVQHGLFILQNDACGRVANPKVAGRHNWEPSLVLHLPARGKQVFAPVGWSRGLFLPRAPNALYRTFEWQQLSDRAGQASLPRRAQTLSKFLPRWSSYALSYLHLVCLLALFRVIYSALRRNGII